MSLADKLKHAFIEEDDNPIPKAPSVSSRDPSSSTGADEFGTPHDQTRFPNTATDNLRTNPYDMDSAVSDAYYQRLLTVTDPAKAHNLQKIFDLEKPLASVIPDAGLRLRGAIAQAQASGITPEAVNSDLNLLQGYLADEEKKFATEIASAKQQHVTDATTAATALEQKIAELQQELLRRHSDIESFAMKLTTAKNRFEAAAGRRRSELARMREQFAVTPVSSTTQKV
jgi:hypothetical protein